jgi:hypothetical protein
MLRRYVSAAVVLLVVGGFVLADTVRGLITSVSDTEVKITPVKRGEKGKKGEKGEAKTFKVSKDTKVLRRKGKGKDAETEDATLDDLKKAIEKSGKGGRGKGVRGSVETDGDNATKITFGGGRRSGGDKRPPSDK